MRSRRIEFNEAEDKLKIIYYNHKDIYQHYYIDFQKGEVYNKQDWEKGKKNPLGRKTSGGEYLRIDVPCPNHTHIWPRGFVDVLAHRLIFYAYHGYLPEIVDHDDKNAKYINAITNLKASDSFHNRWNVENTSGKYRGIEFKYGYYWAIVDKSTINDRGFISEILAVNCRNNYIIKMFLDRYNNLNNFPEKALDKIDESQLFLDQMIQETIEKTNEYKLKHINIQNKKNKNKRKNNGKYKLLNKLASI